MSDVQVLDSVSPARCEWVELLAREPRWQPLLLMHRPYEAFTHWALAVHRETRRYTLAQRVEAVALSALVPLAA